jgi:hypothetical protein
VYEEVSGEEVQKFGDAAQAAVQSLQAALIEMGAEVHVIAVSVNLTPKNTDTAISAVATHFGDGVPASMIVPHLLGCVENAVASGAVYE